VFAHTTGTADDQRVNIRVMFDTGAYTSVLSNAGGTAGSGSLAGVTDAAIRRHRTAIQELDAPFASFKLGDEESAIQTAHRRTRDRYRHVDRRRLFPFASHLCCSKQHKLFFHLQRRAVFN